jgi:hypothetical protein
VSGTPSPPAVDIDPHPSLSWVGELLCPTGSGLRLLRGPSRDQRIIARWLALPSASRPRLLTPLGGAPAAAALGQFNDSMTQAARLRKWAVGQTLRLGAGGLRRRHQVAVAGNTPRPELDLLGSVLPEMIGERVVFAVMIGAGRRPNAKPVLQLLRPDGRVLAYAKVGWNDLTRSLIANEAGTLASWQDRPPETFAVPRPVGSATWNGLSILLVSPVPHRVLRRGQRNAAPPARSVLEVAALGGIEELELANAPMVSRLTAEAGRLADPPARDVAISAIASVIDRNGHRKVAVGTAHGDWGPWNMSRVGGTLHVWDWERTAGGVPVGTDILHLHFQTSALGSRRSVRTTTSMTLAEARGQLAELGVDPAVHGSLMDLYLVELLLRLAAGRSAGVAIRQELLAGVLGVLSDGGASA